MLRLIKKEIRQRRYDNDKLRNTWKLRNLPDFSPEFDRPILDDEHLSTDLYLPRYYNESYRPF